MAVEGGATPRRLNPFAFPSDTDFRFALLVASVLGASLFIYNVLYTSLPSNREAVRAGYERCLQIDVMGRFSLPDFINPTGQPSDFGAAVDEFAACMGPIQRVQAQWMLGGVALLLVVAGALYWAYPVWKMRREGLEPVSAEDAPEVVEALGELVREAGLRETPTFVWNPLDASSGGLAFGRVGRYYVALTGGLVTQFYTDPPAFRAVVLHELAHLRNADVSKTYFAVAVWQAFLAAAVLPFALLMAVNDPWWLAQVGWRIAALAGLVYLTRNAVLRAREVYADVRASVWDGPEGALRRVVEGLPKLKAAGWRRALDFHPDPGVRRRALDDTRGMFRASFWDLFGVGLATTIALPNVHILMSFLRSGTQEIAAALVLAPLVAGMVGIALWRTAFAGWVQGERVQGAGRLGLGLGLGLVAGRALALDATASGALDAGLGNWTMFAVFNAILGVVLVLGLVLYARWVAAGAAVWLAMAAPKESPRPLYLAGLVAAAVVLTGWMALMLFLYGVSENLLSAGSVQQAAVVLFLLVPGTLVLVLYHPLTPLPLMLLWAYPLAARLWGLKGVEAAPEWAFLEGAAGAPPPARPGPLQVGRAVWIAVAGAALFAVVLLVVRVGLRVAVAEETRGTGAFILVFYYGQVAAAVGLQALVALVAAARAQRLSVLYGLGAAFVAGCLMLVGLLGLNVLFGGTAEPSFIWQTFSLMVNAGALAALPAALVGRVFGGGG